MLHVLSIALLLSAPEWRTYEVYEPTIERCFVVDPAAQELKYNHVSSLAWFKGEWICIWNGNAIPAEGKPGQLDYMSRSVDGQHWTPPEPAFAGLARSHNPIPCPKGYQWQPNLVVVGGELWAFWDQNSKDDYAGCYFSRLDEPGGKWRNRRLLWDGAISADEGAPKATLDDKAFRPFPSQNAYVLRSGRILQPVTLMGPKAADAPAALEGWWANEKRSSVIYSDDAGATWCVSPGAIQPGRTWAQWEPTVWEQPDGAIMMLARYNDPRTAEEGGPDTSQCLLWSRSEDGGATWSPHKPVSIETVVSRPYVLPAGGDRFLMVHNDWHAGRFASDRMNLALFFTRGPGLDFVAGPGFTGHEQIVAYPQMSIRDNALLVSYTQGAALRGIKVARIAPLPHPGRYYLFPRTNRPWTGAPKREDDAFRFQGREYLETREPVALGDGPFSLAATLCSHERGVLLDTRGDGRGFVWALTGADDLGGGVVPFVHMGTPDGNIRSRLVVPFGAWTYCGVTVDPEAGSVTFVVNEESEAVPIAPPTKPLRRNTGYIGFKRFERSGLTGFVGSIGAMALFDGMALSAEEHAALAAALAEDSIKPPEIQGHSPTFWLTARQPVAEQAFTFNESMPVARLVQSAGDPAVLEILGDASAGVDLEHNDRRQGGVVQFAFRARIDRGPDAVVCTVGDAGHPVRVAVREGMARLESAETALALGRVDSPAADWFTVLIRSGNGSTFARVDGGAERELAHNPQATWVYLGDGYPSGVTDAPRRMLIDVASVRSCVEK